MSVNTIGLTGCDLCVEIRLVDLPDRFTVQEISRQLTRLYLFSQNVSYMARAGKCAVAFAYIAEVGADRNAQIINFKLEQA